MHPPRSEKTTLFDAENQHLLALREVNDEMTTGDSKSPRELSGHSYQSDTFYFLRIKHYLCVEMYHHHHVKRRKQLLDDVDYEHVDFGGNFNPNVSSRSDDQHNPSLPPPGHQWSKELAAATARETYSVLQKAANQSDDVEDVAAYEGDETLETTDWDDALDFAPSSRDADYSSNTEDLLDDNADFAPSASDAEYEVSDGSGAAAAEEEGVMTGDELVTGLGEAGIGAGGALGVAGLAAWGLWQGVEALADWDKYKEGWEQALDNLEKKGFVDTARDVVVDTAKDINSDIQIVGNTAGLLLDPEHPQGQVASIEEELDTFDKANETVANAIGDTAMSVFNWFADHL